MPSPTVSLPLPELDALAHSHAVRRHIAETATAAGGWLSFARYMELALYAPGRGYYSGGAQKFGAAGDFVTAPEISPLFASTLALQLAELTGSSAPQVIECGAGSGALAADLLTELDRLGVAPQQYGILDLSGELRARQQASLAERAPRLAGCVTWLDAMPKEFSGVVLANEVLDAMPVHLVVWRKEGIFERGVAPGGDNGFIWEERPAQGALLAAAQALPVVASEPPYLSEIALAARAWIETWTKVLVHGALVLIDYGFPQREYYHSQRSMGTLMCHYRHRAHDDPLYLPGLNDISAHVDFTALCDAGLGAGLDLLGYASQGQFLLNCGITDILGRYSPDNSHYLGLASGVQKLINPAEMGELFKVMVLGRGVATPLTGFTYGDRSHTL